MNANRQKAIEFHTDAIALMKEATRVMKRVETLDKLDELSLSQESEYARLERQYAVLVDQISSAMKSAYAKL